MSSIDPSIRTVQDDFHMSAQSNLNTTPSLNGTFTSDSPATLTQLQSNGTVEYPLPPPTPVQYDSAALLRKREDALRATGEILHQRCLKKMERLNQLRMERSKNPPPTVKAASTFQDQQLAILRLEEARLQAECDKLRTNSEVHPEVLPEVAKIRVRQTVQDCIRDYEVMLPHLAKELDDTKAELVSEKKLLKELQEINRALQARRKDLKKLVESGVSQESSQGRQKMLETRVKVQELMRELTGFLSRHYPPVQPDPDDPATFELKHVLEDIMNLSVSQPADPYVVLVPGEYYPPHIEQLINAGIAVRHPNDAQKLRLIDFYS
ncbi:hypothetical protein BGZ79_007164 [Entomortierella chlamydospora]|nr:hypothetical protein BGZ79_007164 [Entomortierella chlamydospora]